MTSDGEWGALNALEVALGDHLAAIRREKAEMRKARIAAGTEERPVSDHAIVRYLERHMGVDVEAVRAKLRSLADNAIPSKDGEHHWHPSGVLMVIGAAGQVVTVLSPEQAAKWDGRKLRNGVRVVAADSAPDA